MGIDEHGVESPAAISDAKGLTLSNHIIQQAGLAELALLGLKADNFAALQDKFVGLIAAALAVDYCGIFRYLPEGDTCILQSGHGWKDGFINKAVIAGIAHSRAGCSILSGKSGVAENIDADSRSPESELFTEHGIVSSASVLIQRQNSAYGSLSVHSTTEHVFTDDAIHFLQAAADILAAVWARMRHEENLLVEHNRLHTLFQKVERVKMEEERTLDCIGALVLLIDESGTIKRCNAFFKEFTGLTYQEILGRDWRIALQETGLATPVDLHSNDMEIFHKASAKWFVFRSFPLLDREGKKIPGTVLTLHDTTVLKLISEELSKKNIEVERGREELQKAFEQLKDSQAQLLQQEKMASIGQLAAGIAHEINNPMGFIGSNLNTMGKYLTKFVEFLNGFEKELESMKEDTALERLRNIRKKLKIDYILKDADDLINESIDGAKRVKDIVLNLKSFSRVDQAEHKLVNINECIDSTINIVWNELKYKATLTKDYGDLPLTKCYPQQLNQVFMNLLVNAAQAIAGQGAIAVRSWYEDGFVLISISDSGSGIPEENLQRIFEPFFTTKPVGKGTGLGLSIAYDIITKKHNGNLAARSELGKGTTFTVKIPVVEE
jgi:two-component system NtrC family sensor kinase